MQRYNTKLHSSKYIHKIGNTIMGPVATKRSKIEI